MLTFITFPAMHFRFLLNLASINQFEIVKPTVMLKKKWKNV